MFKVVVGAMAVALSLVGTGAANATAFTALDMNIRLGPNGTISARFGNSGIPAGMFTDTFTFRLPANGVGSGSVITTAEMLGGATDLDLISVDVNGMPAFGFTGALNEAVFVNGVPITANAFNVVTIKGFSRGNGSYGANATFSPLPTPEPATWMMLVAGFGMVGFAARQHRRVRVAFS